MHAPIRRLVLLALLLPLLALAASCGRDDIGKVRKTPDGRIVVEFWHAMGGPPQGVLNTLIDRFNAGQDRYRVVGVFQGNYDALNQKLIASLYAGRNPAAAQMYEGWTTRFIRFGYLKPVSDFLAEEPAYAEELRNDMFPVFYDGNLFETPESAGEPVLATLPFNKSVYVLCINLDMMQAAGYQEGPKTWAEFSEMARAMVKRDAVGEVQTYGFGTRAIIESYTQNLFMTGVNYLDEEENVLFDGPEGLAAMKFLVEMSSQEAGTGYVEPGFLSSPFGNGKIAMYISSTAGFSYNDQAAGNKFVWRAFPLPGMDEATPGRVLAQGTNVGIFGRNVPEEAQRGAWEFLKFLNTPESLTLWCGRTGYMPTRRSLLDFPEYQEVLAKDVNLANTISSLDRLMFEPKPIYWDNCRAIISRAVQAVLTGLKTPEEALADASEQVRDVVQSNRAPEKPRAERERAQAP
ncbi:MAG: ABC transporter substrate-binding protein [Candidatus Sumerlaeia bacterium]|nr:ABC transporter substrate-binding protein [Candidatus Sumerlaeia bacterium]